MTQIAECMAVFKKNAEPVGAADGVPQTDGEALAL